MRRLGYLFTAAWQGFSRNLVMSAASSVTVALMLVLLTFFAIAERGLEQAVRLFESKVEVALYLEDSAKPSEILALKARIEADPAVSRVVFVTKDEALQRLRASGQVAIVDLETNPLPASLEVKLAQAQEAPRLTARLRNEVGAGVVKELVDNPAVVGDLLTVTRLLSAGGLAVLAMMLFVTLFVIVNTIRIAVHARRDEIEIMRLVGASDRLIRWPFIIEGMLVGVAGALGALAVIAALAPTVSGAVAAFAGIVPLDFGGIFAAQLAGGVLGLALLVGAGGAGLSVRSHLTA